MEARQKQGLDVMIAATLYSSLEVGCLVSEDHKPKDQCRLLSKYIAVITLTHKEL